MSAIIGSHVQDAWFVLTLGGDVDIQTASELRVGLMHALSLADAARHAPPGEASQAKTEPVPPGIRGLVVDLTEVTFLESAGLGVLIKAYKQAATQGTPLRFAGATDQIMRLFQLTGVDTILDLHPSVETACTTSC